MKTKVNDDFRLFKATTNEEKFFSKHYKITANSEEYYWTESNTLLYGKVVTNVNCTLNIKVGYESNPSSKVRRLVVGS